MWWFFVPVCETTTIEATAERGAPANIADQWWLGQLTSLDGYGCRQAVDKIELVEIDPRSSGPELYMHIVETCPNRPSFDLEPGDRSEFALICGLGATGTPSCVDMRLGVTRRNGRGTHHAKLEIDCTGTAVTTEWRRDHGEPLSHRRDQLVFP